MKNCELSVYALVSLRVLPIRGFIVADLPELACTGAIAGQVN